MYLSFLCLCFISIDLYFSTQYTFYFMQQYICEIRGEAIPVSWKRLSQSASIPPVSPDSRKLHKSPCPFTENRAKIKMRNVWCNQLQDYRGTSSWAIFKDELQLFLATLLSMPFLFSGVKEGEEKRSVKIVRKSGIQAPSAPLHSPNSMLVNVPVPTLPLYYLLMQSLPGFFPPTIKSYKKLEHLFVTA